MTYFVPNFISGVWKLPAIEIFNGLAPSGATHLACWHYARSL
jgi:hypothetical protein